MMGETVKQSEVRPDIFRLWCDYYTLCKPKVVALIVFTAIVGMFLSVPGMVPWQPLIFGTLGIGLAAASAAAINQIVDQKIDAQMQRTSKRPLPSGTITNKQALLFSALLGIASMVILIYLVNPLTAVLTLLSLIGYAFVYTMYLKRATPQNIVIGGAAGAAPPVLGWTAVTGHIHPDSLLLFLIIYTWTPPHFWALAIHKREEYARVNVPMLPVTHGVQFTRLHVLLYTIIMFGVTLLPFATRMSGWLYFIGALILGGIFLYYAIRMQSDRDPKIAIKTFGYSILYLMLLFALLLIDHYIPLLLALWQ
ncbi:heme o synthase [Thiohalophilus sp.]|uniref:heme o synthase n=1 Tax=Thiohalophilus sp. TaxID=3028392 RepID=UPI002ACE75F0|nr:heme o synthase [Thiohalophilus sp.]MDZ7803696.1 heme o synthase [Thiohalophilus sp.]